MPPKVVSLRTTLLLLALVLPSSLVPCLKASRLVSLPVYYLLARTFSPLFLWRIRRGLYYGSPILDYRRYG